MEGRCAVETWAQFGFSGGSYKVKILCGFGTDVLICTGTEEIYVFSKRERKITTVLLLPAAVSDLVGNQDKHLIYVACRSGVYRVNLQFLLHRDQSSQADASSSPAELKISQECLVVGADEVSSLLLVGSVLLTLCQRDASWLLTLYKTPKQTASTSHEEFGSFHLPVVSAVDCGAAESNRRPRKGSVLICIHSGDVEASSPSNASAESTVAQDHFHLEPLLFKLLFGVEAALAKSPVILCGLPDGRLCFLPLRLPGSRLRVLHSLEQPVCFVGASVVTETGHAQCLVAAGEQGRVVLIKTDKAGSEGGSAVAAFTEGCVPGPVWCGCMDKSCFYYSTGADLLRLDLSEGSFVRESKERGEETSGTTAAALQSPSSLNVCRVIALAEPARSTAAGDVQLLGVSARGQLQRICLPAGRVDEGSSKLPSTQVSRSVRDLLSAIGDVCERASVLKTVIKSKNQFLRLLNHAISISFLLMADTTTDLPIKEKPIRCHFETSWSRLLQKDSLSLVCFLHNSSPFVLERGWTLSITVSPLSYSSSPAGESSSTNFSFPFHDLCPGQTFEASLPIAAAGDASFPMTVSCSLIFSLSSLLGEEEVAASFAGLQSSCISLPLSTLTVDWLHALQLNSPTATHKMATVQPSSAAADSIRTFLSSRQLRCSGRTNRGGESAAKPEPEKYSASVWVSSEIVRDTLKPKKSSNLDTKESIRDPEDLCLSLLERLLSEDTEGVKMGCQGDKIALSTSVVHACGPNGAAMKLTVKEINVGEEESTDKEATIEVQIESSSLAAVCGLHHAVLRRIQTLLQSATEKAASTKNVQILGLRRALQRAEIQQSQISGAFGEVVSTVQRDRLLLTVYQELRQNPLLIV
ncbi:Fanconi anemia core complex-associated protein 100 isoform X1 [Neolamprologus brichardi]|uniref:Fanconi anemia core complex-associated protein 100 isoform X1 n=1 Tax=Neolamprologus brichardi TaxID=32507 RepID=UPI0003EBECC2|nr:Fanconi anemia core complex-associated protein 100 isoform X1 [Neolamprologus brichardi]